jgi:hypothetical protein
MTVARRLVELTQQMGLFRRLREIHFDRLPVSAGHDHNVCRFAHQRVRQGLAADLRDVHPPGAQDFDRMLAWRLAVARGHARGTHFHIRLILHRGTEDPFSHGAAADISGADKKDVFHGTKWNGKIGRLVGQVNAGRAKDELTAEARRRRGEKVRSPMSLCASASPRLFYPLSFPYIPRLSPRGAHRYVGRRCKPLPFPARPLLNSTASPCF